VHLGNGSVHISVSRQRECCISVSRQKECSSLSHVNSRRNGRSHYQDIVVVCPSKSMKTTLSSVYCGMGSEMANETNPWPQESVALLTLMQKK
jgi:hypothetical protein